MVRTVVGVSIKDAIKVVLELFKEKIGPLTMKE